MQLCQKAQNQLSSPLIIAERFHFFRFVICRPKALHYAAYIFVLYVLLTQTAANAACSVESFLPPPSNILPNVHAVIPDLLSERTVLIEQVYWNCALKFFDLSGDGISEVMQSVNPVFSQSQKMSQQSKGEADDKTHRSSQNVWKPCIHIMIAEICGLFGYFVALVIYEEFRKK
jgi:hypothetical protein